MTNETKTKAARAFRGGDHEPIGTARDVTRSAGGALAPGCVV